MLCPARPTDKSRGASTDKEEQSGDRDGQATTTQAWKRYGHERGSTL